MRKSYVIISITVMAWNISLFPTEEQAEVQNILFSPLFNQHKGDELAALLDQIKILIRRKNLDYPSIREYIHKHTLSLSGDTITLTVETEEVPEEIKKRVSLKTSTKGGYNFKA